MRGQWEKMTGAYELGEKYRIGKIVVASAFYDGGEPKGSKDKYRAATNLPGIKKPAGKYPTLEEAKERAEKLVEAWFGFLS